MPQTSFREAPVYVISLDRSADRFASFLARNSHVPGIIRARAVDGQGVDRADLLARGILGADANYSNASLGCAISHACIWRIASGSDAPLTVAEDDALFRGDFAAAAEALIAALPSDWDFVLWGWNFNSMLCVDLVAGVTPGILISDQDLLRANVDRFRAARDPASAFRLLRAHGSPAYSVSPRGASKLLRLCLPIRSEDVPFPVVNQLARNDGIDMMMSLAYPQMRAFVSVPPLVASENWLENSTIKGRP